MLLSKRQDIAIIVTAIIISTMLVVFAAVTFDSGGCPEDITPSDPVDSGIIVGTAIGDLILPLGWSTLPNGSLLSPEGDIVNPHDILTYLNSTPDTPATAVEMYVLSITEAVVGEQFEVIVMVDPLTSISGAQVDFGWTPGKVEVVDIREGDLFAQGGQQKAMIRTKSEYIVQPSAVGLISSTEVSGSLLRVTFVALESGVCSFILANPIVGDADANPLEVDVFDGAIYIMD